MKQVLDKAILAKKASRSLAILSTTKKNLALQEMATALIMAKDDILTANLQDVKNAKAKGQTDALIDRLALNEKRLEQMAQGLRDVSSLPDPVGEVLHMSQRPNGLQIGKKRVPIGVIGFIYEARPNVTADAVGLCLKSGNAVVLRGGSEAILSNTAIVRVLRDAVHKAGVDKDFIQLIEDTSRDSATALMQLNGYIDVLIPRGGAGLIQSVVKNATVPVIETGTGNCHVYIDGESDLEMGQRIIVNAKTSRPSVCNAAESLLVDKAIAESFLPDCAKALTEKGVEIRGCPVTCSLVPTAKKATPEDYATEYLDLILAVKVVDGIDEAIAHITEYGTRHSECIVTNNYFKAQKFLQEVDAAAVYVNASTRFTDGGEFGFGAEIGISNQKLSPRGPVGLPELTTKKYIIYGTGQIRE